MKRIVITLSLLAMIFVGCEKTDNLSDSILTESDSQEKYITDTVTLKINDLYPWTEYISNRNQYNGPILTDTIKHQ